MPIVELVDAEVIVPRGRRKTTWFVRHNDGWVRAAEHPKATIESLDAGPGTVFERRIEIALPKGTRVCRVDSAPAGEPRRDPLAHLVRARRSQRRTTRRTELSVGPRGELVRDQRRSG
jgi:hypothetical protein